MRRIWSLGAVGLYALVGVAVAQDAPGTTDEARDRFNEGRQAFQQGDYEAARTAFQAAATLRPESAELLVWLGTTCLKIGDAATAAGNAEAATTANQEAKQHLEAAAALQPDLGLAWNNLGKAYYELGDLDNAERCFKEALAKPPQPNQSRTYVADAHRNLGLVYQRRENRPAAIEQFQAAIAENANDAEAWGLVGQTHRDAGALPDAEQAYAKYTELSPQALPGWLALGDIRLELGRYQEAAEAYKQAYGLDANSGDAALGLGTAWYYVRTKAHEPPTEAEPYLRQASELLPESFAGWYNLGLTLKELGRYQEALSAFDTASRLQPERAPVYNQLGYAYFFLSRNEPRQLEQAEAAFRRAVGLDPTLYEAWVNLALIGEKLQKTPETQATWQEILQRFPERATAHLGYGNFLFDHRGDNPAFLDQAMLEFQRAVQADDTLVEGCNNLGLVYLEKKQPVEAMVQFRKALHIDPRYPYALNNLGVAHELMGELDEACRRYREALQVDPEFQLAKDNFERLKCADRLGGQ